MFHVLASKTSQNAREVGMQEKSECKRNQNAKLMGEGTFMPGAVRCSRMGVYTVIPARHPHIPLVKLSAHQTSALRTKKINSKHRKQK